MRFALILISVVAAGQTFEVATVKPALAGGPIGGIPVEILNIPGNEALRFGGGPGSNTPTRIDYRGVTLKMLVERAYDVKPAQVSGPGWIEEERYDVAATMATSTTIAQMRVMLQALLAERFQLTLRREAKTLPVYSLTVAKDGSKLKPGVKPQEFASDDERKAATRANLVASMQRLRAAGGPRSSFGHANGTMAELAESLSKNVDRPVRDRTGLEGKFGFTVEFVPDSALAKGAEGPSIYAAVEEQLGLHLQKEDENSELLIVEKAEKVPAGN